MKPHPFPVVAWFDLSCTLTFAVPADELRRRLPPSLEPDLFDDRWGFLAVAVVRTRRLRPKGFPPFLGHDFILAGYRYFVRYRDVSGRTLRGLMILRSVTDKRRMVALGNLFTRYRYQHAPLGLSLAGNDLVLRDRESPLRIEATLGGELALPPDSPFADWREARRFCGPMPFTFSHDEARRRVVVVEGVRANWKPEPAQIRHFEVPFLDTLGFRECRLANAFVVRDIPYEWRSGRVEPWPR